MLGEDSDHLGIFRNRPECSKVGDASLVLRCSSDFGCNKESVTVRPERRDGRDRSYQKSCGRKKTQLEALRLELDHAPIT